MSDNKMEASVIFESYLPEALGRALEYAGEEGFVASMPQLLNARVNAADDNEIWKLRSLTSNSEESVVTTEQGNQVVVVAHGGGIFASPERFRKLYHSSVHRLCETGFTGLFGAKITTQEARNIVAGRLPDGSELPVYPYREFAPGIRDLPRRYAVVMDFETARTSKCGNLAFDELKDDPLMIARAGGIEAAAAYLDRAKQRNKSKVMGSWHSFNDVDPHQPQTRVLFLGGNEGGAETEVLRDLSTKERGYVGVWGTHYRIPIEAEYGIRGDTAMINMARYIAVAPRDSSTGLRHLDFGA